VGPVAQSVQRLATGWTVRGSNPGGGEIFRACPVRPWVPPSLLYNGYRFFLGGKSGRGVTLTPHPLLVPWSRKSRAIPPLPQWAVRPVQSLIACTRVHFTLPFICFGITSTKCRINTVVSPDDGHTFARNMWRKEINILRKIVHQIGFSYKNVH